MLAVTGRRSRIVTELGRLIPPGTEIVRIGYRDGPVPKADRYVLAAGLLLPRQIRDQSPDETALSADVNGIWPIRLCEEILAGNDMARICVIGSESAFRGSYDTTYAAAKAALHHYVETRRLPSKHQQLVAVSPGIIADCGMTIRRHDQQTLRVREAAHPKRRFVTAAEVAAIVHHLLYVDLGYITGTVVRVHGGEPSTR